MNFMTCTTCQRVVQVNCSGVCLSCQRGFQLEESEDAYITYEVQEKKLEERLEEIEYALQKPETKSLDAPEQTKDRKGVGSRNPQRKKASTKGKKKK